MTAAHSIIVIGGGASGILLSAHLLRQSDPRLRVTIIEKRGQLGRGLAFSSDQANYILNVPAANMSAYADEPDHFHNWLLARHPELPDDPWLFAPRPIYGEYLGELVRSATATASGDARLTVVDAQAVAVRERPGGMEVELADGTCHVAQAVVLAVGHEEQPSRGNGVAVRAGSDADTPIDPEASVMILGSGLSMVDAWLTLAARRHRGPIRIVSRHGLLPLPHQRSLPLAIDAADVPFGTNLPYLTRWFRSLVQEAEANGNDWRSVVDGLRPFNQRLWQSWPADARRQFLKHLRPFWNIHRHRVPPGLHSRLQRAIVNGQIQLMAGEVLHLERFGDGVRAAVRRRGHHESEAIVVHRVYDCGGIALDVETTSNPAIRSLLEAGAIRPDPQRIGLDVTTDLNAIAADGTTSSRLFAVGPLTRGQFFEIEAVPDIRRQCADLAQRLLG